MRDPRTTRIYVRALAFVLGVALAIPAACTEGAGPESGAHEGRRYHSSSSSGGPSLAALCTMAPIPTLGGSGSDGGPPDAPTDGMGSGFDGTPIDAFPDGMGSGSDGPPMDAFPDGMGSGSDGGPPTDGPTMDAPPIDGSPTDGPTMDAPPMDGPPMDGPPMDGPPMDGPPTDGPPMDGPPTDGGMSCRGLDIIEATVPLVPMGTGTAEVRSIPNFTDQLVSASIVGDAFAFTTPGCGPQACNFAASPKTLPFVLAISCNATDGASHVGVLRVQGTQGPEDFDTATLTCAGSANVPLISVAPAAIDAGDVPVNTTANRSFTVTNNGTAALTFSLTLPAMAPGWTAPGSPCIAPAQCTVAPGGGTSVVALQFTPPVHGTSAGTISIASNAGSRAVDITGNGIGSRIEVIDPDDNDLDFGTIPRNSVATRTITVQAIGNLPVSLAAAPPTAPFTATPPQLTLAPGIPQQFTIGCGAATATGPVNQTIALSSVNAYALEAASIAVHCEVANTQLSVTPSAFDFMEVRRGEAAPILPFTISNPGPIAAMVTEIALAGAPAPLSINIDGPAFPRALGVGETITGRLSLATEQDLDLDQSAPKLRINVDGEQLVYPVTGKVTTPSAYVTPERLELGTACAGTSLTSTVSMINNGTARLLMEPPQLDEAFALDLQSPPEYPAPLLAGTMATIGITPRSPMPGKLSGTLTWAVDAPRSPFSVEVDLEFIETGTAISPNSLSFSTVKIDEVSIRYTVTLQNCSAAPVTVSVDGVNATRGAMAAWRLEPSQDERTLAPQDKLTIGVSFAPRYHGRHIAQLRLGVDGEPRFVELTGDGLDVDFKQTSFYACGCTAPRVRSGWPIVLAVTVVVLRRRRRRRT